MKTSKLKFSRDASKRLRQLREQLGYTQPQMAKYLGVTPSGYRKNESGENFPHITILYRFFTEHNISMDWFLFGKGPMNHAGPKIEAQQKRIRELEDEVQRLTQDQETNVRRLTQELETVTGNYERDKEQLGQLLEQTEGIRDIHPDVKEMAMAVTKDPELYHQLMLHFLRYKKERPQSRKDTKSG